MKQYLDVLREIYENGSVKSDRTGTGTKSIFGVQMRFDLEDGFPLLTTKKLPFRWIAEELFWFLSGSTDERDLRERGVDIWKEWATVEQTARFGRPEGKLGPVYGHLWRNFGAKEHAAGSFAGDGVDQITKVVDQIRNNPDSRRHIVSGWDPQTCDAVALPPCHTLFQFYVDADRRLSCQLYQRSADFFLGIPFNIASYALLTHLVADCCGLTVGDFVHTIGDAHLYLNHLDAACTQLGRSPKRPPILDILGPSKRYPYEYSYEDLLLRWYDPEPKIEAEVSV